MTLDTRLLHLAGWLTAAALSGGCAGNAYLDAKRYTAAGGQMEQETNAANARLTAAQDSNARLRGDVASRDQQIAADARRIKALGSDLRAQDARLQAALQAGRVTQARHAQLKRELDGLQADTQSVELANDQSRMSKTSDAKDDDAKRARLRDLETRKKLLETQLGALRPAP